MNCFKWVGILLVLIFSSTVSAQKIAFDYLGLREGLSQITVTCILQDSIGRIWMGTRDGLNVYDGQEIKVFRPERGNPGSLLGHNVRDLEVDGESIWACTYAGVSCLNIRTQQFKQYQFDGVLCILPFKNTLLVGTNRGLFELDSQHESFQLKSEVLTDNTSVTSLHLDNAGILWICTHDGLYKYNPARQITSRVLDGHINTVFTDSQKRVWVGTNGDGMFLLNRQQEVIRHFKHLENSHSLINNIIRDINEDSKGNIWIGTFLGLSVLDGRSYEIQNYSQTDEGANSLSHNSIYCIMRDRQGTMWIGTYFGGVNYYNPDFQIFNRYEVRGLHPGGIGYRVVGKMLEDEKNNLWIATEGGGLDYFDRQSKTFKHYRHEEGHQGLSHNTVKALLMVDKSTLMVGTHMGGLNIFDLKTSSLTHYHHIPGDTTSLQSDVITSIISFHGSYLLGTHKGVVQFDPVTKVFTPFFKDKEMQAIVGDVVYYLFEDSFGVLWIGTEKNGLVAYNITDEKITNYKSSGQDLSSISNNTVYTIYEDHQFRLWIGTFGGGINRYIREKDCFENYSQKTHGLPSDFIFGIQESRYGNLWVATGKGLSRFDVDNKHFYNYHHANGFPLDALNEGALYLTSDGEVFVGGINGLISFKEEDLLKKNNDFNLIFSSLFVNNNEVVPGDDTGVLKQDLAFTDAITLNANQNIFTIDYSACNYITTNQCKYQYILEGFNSDWVNSGSQTSVTYTNLDPGTYTLKIRGLSSVDNMVVDVQSLNITVEPPFYKTWYAYFIYLLLIGGIIFWLNQIYLSKVRLVDSLKAEKREKEQIKELNQSKLRFFTNISHEFRTPLTLITGTLESILEDTKTSARNYRKLLTINSNASRLNNLITELLDFRKLEQGFLSLKVAEYNMVSFMDEIFHSFVEYAQYHNVDYQFKTSSPTLTMWFDKKQMEKVFYNLLSNAFKFVDNQDGRVKVEVVEQTDVVDIVVSDNGPGMAADEKAKIFDRFYQIDKVSGKTMGQGSGIGLALCKGIIKEHQGQIMVNSKEGEGTSFIVRIKKGNKHFDELQLNYEADTQEQMLSLVKWKEEQEEDIIAEPLPEDAPQLLLVEDNPEARKLLKDIFASSYEVIEATDGNEGLKAALEYNPDLIISDVMMPNMSGTQMCARIKRNVQISHIPVILLTARTALEYKIEGIETGADDYITKPFNTRLLRARVKNLLQSRAIIQKKYKQDPKAEVKEVATNSLDRKLMEKASLIIEQHMDDTDFDVNYFARELGLGRTRLYSKIKGVTGLTPNEFILSTRLKKAAEMLLGENEMNVSEIAYAVGFSTPRYFSRCFREHFGVSPSKYGNRSCDSNSEENDNTDDS